MIRIDKAALIGAGMIVQRPDCVLSYSVQTGQRDTDNIWDLLPNGYKKQYANISSYVRYGLAASHGAWKDIPSVPAGEKGVYSGTALGGAPEVYTVQADVYAEKGISWMMPSMVMNKVPKTTADILTIEKKLLAGNLTLAGGRTSSGLALMQALDDIVHKEVSMALVVGADSIDAPLRRAYIQLGLSPHRLTGGGCALCLCHPQFAPRKDTIAYLLSCSCTADYPNSESNNGEKSHALYEYIRNVLYSANLRTGDIDAICYAKAYRRPIDFHLEQALRRLFPACIKTAAVCATDLYGDMLGTNPLLTILTAVRRQIEAKQGWRRLLCLAPGIDGQLCTAIVINNR